MNANNDPFGNMDGNVSTEERDAVVDEQMDLLLKSAHGSGPDPFLADRLLQAVREGRRPDTNRAGSRLVAAAVLLGAVCVVGLFGWRTQQPRLAQDPKLQKAFTELRETGKRTEAALIIHRAGPAAVPSLIKALGDKDPEYIESVQELLAAAGKPAVAPLRGLLRGEDRLLQRRAIQTLNLMGAEATPAIADLLPVLEQAGAPREAIVALGTLVVYSSEDDHRQALESGLLKAVYMSGGPYSKPQPHRLVIRAMQRSGVEKRTDRGHLHELLAGKDPYQRELAAQLLAQCGDASSVAPLQEALSATHPRLSRATLRAGGVSAATVQKVNNDAAVQVAAARALVKLAPRKASAAPAYALLVREGTILERHSAAEALGRLGVATPEVVSSLRTQLGGRDIRLIAAVVTSLGMLGPAAKDAGQQLRNIDRWGNKELKALVAAALRQIEKK